MRWLTLLFCFAFFSCSIQKKLSKSAKENVLTNKALTNAHVGISIYEPATGKYWYEYQGDKYFVPASNTKIPTCYAAMKYLGDSLVGLRYGISEPSNFIDTAIAIQPTGDPTFLHADFKKQPVLDFLRAKAALPHIQLGIRDYGWDVRQWGSGWSWTDYDADYMAEKNVFPVYGNVLNIRLNKPADRIIKDSLYPGKVNLFKTQSKYFDSLLNKEVNMKTAEEAMVESPKVEVGRPMTDNNFVIRDSRTGFTSQSIPFVTNASKATQSVLYHDFGITTGYVSRAGNSAQSFNFYYPEKRMITIKKWFNIYSQPTDSMLKPMMHRSDNFFAEQSLLMVSNELLGEMNDSKIIDTLLKTDFKDLPQKPRWADGSGLSRYNLFTPEDMVAILNKMKNEFGMNRIKVIFATGGEGTISSYYKTEAGYIYGKTGTLSGVVAFSGFLTTKNNKELIFSVLVNNHQASATDVRRAVEKFLQGLRNNY
jgi:serine-type D-Ala-D-Ala carboxypeptidase/endopeptidase (penicillin-binding protein 4)